MSKRGCRKSPVGPKKRPLIAGAPRRPTYGGAANDYFLHPCLASVARLRMVSWLCVMGPTTARGLQQALGLPNFNSAYWSLYGMKRMELVAVTGHPNGALWEVTEDGRRWLWRFGFVTARIELEWMRWDVPEGARPWDVIARDVQPEFLRPSALCLTVLMRYWFPATIAEASETLGRPQSSLRWTLRAFARRGWLEGGTFGSDIRSPRTGEDDEAAIDPSPYFQPRPKRRAPRKWIFNVNAYQVQLRHVEALRVAALMSGYSGWEDDWFRIGNDQAGWLERVDPDAPQCPPP